MHRAGRQGEAGRLRTDRAEGGSLAPATPIRRWLWRSPTQRTHRRRSVGDTLEGDGVINHHSVQRAALDTDDIRGRVGPGGGDTDAQRKKPDQQGGARGHWASPTWPAGRVKIRFRFKAKLILRRACCV